MPGIGESTYKRKGGKWEGRYLKSCSPKEKMQDILFGDMAEQWLQNAGIRVKESTAARYHYLLHSYLLPKWQNYKVKEITTDALQEYSTWLMTKGGMKGKGLSAKSVADIMTVLKNILRFAESKGYSMPNDMRLISVKQSQKKLRVLSVMEQQKLCRYLYSDLNSRNVGILLCLYTGLRVGEVCALRWEDISLEERTLHVRRTMQRIQVQEKIKEGDISGNEPRSPMHKTQVIVTSPKSACSIREIPLTEQLLLLLDKYPLPRMGYFLTGSSEAYDEPRQMQRYFKKVLELCGLEETHFHTLRHTFATRCVELGFDVKSLSEILGHANIHITMNRYVHPSMEVKREHMKKLEGVLLGSFR